MKKAIISTLMIMITAATVAGSVSATGALQAEPAVAQNGSASQDDERVYCLASVSKVYVTAAVMQLSDRGLVDLDAPVTEYIPDFKMADPRYNQQSHHLNH